MPSVQSRLTSSVSPSSKWRDTGLPQIATPHTPPLVHARDGELMTSCWLVVSMILLHKFIGEFQCAWFNFQQCIYILYLDFWLSQRSVCTIMSSVPYNPHDFHSWTAGLLTVKEIGSPSQRQNV